MKFLINPFERIAGWQALAIGVVVMAITAVIGHINHIAFDGVLDIHAGAIISLSTSFIMQAVDLFALFLTMWLAGICFSKTKLRAIDVAGTMALARVPMLLLAIVCFLPVIPKGLFDMPRIIVFALICLPFSIWMIALMYNAYTVSCNLKGTRAVVTFIVALIVAEIVSKLIFFFFLSSLFVYNPMEIKASYGASSIENITSVADSLTIQQKTENVVKSFEQSEFEYITIYFDATIKKTLTPSVLKMTWMQVNMTYGKFEKADLDNLKEIRTEKYDIIEVPFHFQKETLKLRLVFDKEGIIGGLFIQPNN